MSETTHSLTNVPNLKRIENFSKEDLQALAMELTHAVYPHEEVYGQYCTLESYIDCPPDDVFRYLSDTRTLAEWTYSLRGFEPVSDDGLYVSYDKIGGKTKIYTRTVAHQAAGTVDYHCAWDQGEHLWMIYLMRVVPAQLVLNRPGSVVTWTNCRHPFYDKNPHPELGPSDRKVWVGDMWPFFYAGHHVEFENLKHILEYRSRHGLVINPYEVVS
jgi:hypothetical protein